MASIERAKKIGNTYQNPIHTRQLVGSRWKLFSDYFTVNAEREPKTPIGPFITKTEAYRQPPATGLRITWMGHSSLLLEIDGKRFLTDPVTGHRASFVSWAGPKRFFPYPVDIRHLPKLDAIILSHDHYDHLCYPTIKKLMNDPVPFICSKGVGAILMKWGIAANRITELEWGESTSIGDCTIIATPARHFSGRGLTNRNQTLWSSFVIKGNKHNIFFGADSGIFPGFKDIGDNYGPFDLTMLEVGAYGEGWPDIHMGPDNATDAHLALKGKVMMPIHWGTFNLALHAWREPVEKALEYAKAKGIHLFLPTPGEVVDFNGAHNSKWWEK